NPQDFGALGIYVSILSVMAAVGSLHYDKAIPLVHNSEESLGLAKLSLFILTGVSLFALVLTLIFSNEFSVLLNEEKLKEYLWLVPVGVFLLGLYNISNYLAVKDQLFTAIGKSKISQSVAAVFIQIGLGLALANPFGLILGHIISQSVGTT